MMGDHGDSLSKRLIGHKTKLIRNSTCPDKNDAYTWIIKTGFWAGVVC